MLEDQRSRLAMAAAFEQERQARRLEHELLLRRLDALQSAADAQGKDAAALKQYVHHKTRSGPPERTGSASAEVGGWAGLWLACGIVR